MMLLIRACIVRVCSLLPFILLFWSSTTTPTYALKRSRLKSNGFTGCFFFYNIGTRSCSWGEWATAEVCKINKWIDVDAHKDSSDAIQFKWANGVAVPCAHRFRLNCEILARLVLCLLDESTSRSVDLLSAFFNFSTSCERHGPRT